MLSLYVCLCSGSPFLLGDTIYVQTFEVSDFEGRDRKKLVFSVQFLLTLCFHTVHMRFPENMLKNIYTCFQRINAA